jgi:hypothetical protein
LILTDLAHPGKVRDGEEAIGNTPWRPLPPNAILAFVVLSSFQFTRRGGSFGFRQSDYPCDPWFLKMAGVKNQKKC